MTNNTAAQKRRTGASSASSWWWCLRTVCLGWCLCGTLGTEDTPNIRSRELKETEIFHRASLSGGRRECRCEYPGEEFLGPEMDLAAPIGGGDRGAIRPYRTVGSTVVLPSDDPACASLWFLCPGVRSEEGTLPWTHRCSAEDGDETNGQRRTTQQRSVVDRPYYTKEGVAANGFPEGFHHLLDDEEKERMASSVQYYTQLPADNPFCKDGGSRIRSGGATDGCDGKLLAFNKAGDRRPLPGGTFVSNEWFPTLGVSVSAQGDGDHPHNVHPCVYDPADPDPNALAQGVPEKLGLVGMEPEDLPGNLLVPLRREQHPGSSGRENDNTLLVFDFFQRTTVRDLTLFHAGAFSRVFATLADGSQSVKRLDGPGEGGFQTVGLGLENVVRLAVGFQGMGGVVSMDLCLDREPSRGSP